MKPSPVLVCFALFCCVACDSTSGPSGEFSGGSGGSGGSGAGTMSARVAGEQWTASSVTVTNQTGASPILTVRGAGVLSGDPSTRTTTIEFSIANPAVGIFQLDALGVQTGSLTLQIADVGSSMVWVASPTTAGSSGTVQLTVFGAGRAVGTFSATVLPSTGGATGNRSVTTGVFDVDF